MPPYGLLLVGGSHTHQENYARSFAADPRCRLIGLTDESDVCAERRALNKRLAGELSIPYLDDLDDALAREDVQLVSVCVEPERRGRVAVRCARAGKHLYLDKPLAASIDDARKIVAAVKEQRVLSQMFSLVRSPAAARARDDWISGRLGQPIGLHCELMFAKGVSGTADLSQPRHETALPKRFTWIDSKRELFCVGLYPLVLFQWLAGKKVKTVHAVTANYFFEEHQRNDAEDFACVLLGYEGGVEATITVGRTGWSSHPREGIHQIRLVGSERSMMIDAWRPRLEVYSDNPSWRPPAQPHPDDPMGFWSSTAREIGIEPKSAWQPIGPIAKSDGSYFLDCLEQQRESDVSAAVGAHAVEVIMAAYRSAASGQTVSL